MRHKTPVAMAALTIALLITGLPLAAQSITSVQRLGYPLLPADGRTQAMGGLGIGLQGLSTSLVNPASPAHVLRRGVVVVVENSDREIELGDASGTAGATRFPLFRVLYPVQGVVVTLGYGTFLDQSWGVIQRSTETVGSGTVDVEDEVESVGGLGQLHAGVAVPLGDRLALGAAVGVYTGSQRVRYVRSFTSEDAGFEDFDETFGWRYVGPLATAGVQWDPLPSLRLGAAVQWSGTLSADSMEGRAAAREVDLPLQASAGASAYLSSSLLASVSARWNGWSVSAIEGSPARDTWELGAGLEFDNPESRSTRSYPLRLGVQYRQLPFTFVTDAPVEWFVGGGVGMRVGTDVENPLAVVDLTVQRGNRTAAGDGLIGDLTEGVWRVSLSLALFGT